MLYYLRSHYFVYLQSWGLNILHSIPVWNEGSSTRSYAMTDIAFHVYSKMDIHRQNWAQIAPELEPIIVILGMTGTRKLSERRLPYSAQWSARAVKSLGMVCVARKAFMDERLLGILAKFNAGVTIVPVFLGVESGQWRLELTTWGQHTFRKDSPCNMEVISESDGELRYRWQHRDDWSYEHEGNSNMVNGVYTLSCKCHACF